MRISDWSSDVCSSDLLSGIELANSCRIHIRQQAPAIGGAVDAQVMPQPEFAGRKLHVEFQPLRAHPDTGLDREQGVLRRMAARTVMAHYGERPIFLPLRSPVRSRRPELGRASFR